MKKRMSLSVQLTLVMIFLVAGTIGLCWFLNNTFLEKFYVYNKQTELLDGFEQINQASEDGTLLTEDFDITFEKICINGNINIIVAGSDRKTIRSFSANQQLLQMKLNKLITGGKKEEHQILVSTDQYIVEMQWDSIMQSEYLILYGWLSDGNYVYMQTALESIRESADITNQFFVVIGVCALVVCAVIIIIVSQSISRPIRKLSNISEKMSNLEFEAKYQSGPYTSWELEELGQHMNEMSASLEKTISELKIANNELMQDIEKKERIDEMRKEFLSNVSHELKTPLALIQGYAEGLKECVNEEDGSRDFYCEVIVDEADKMNQMVRKLLTLNQLEFGNDVVELERFDMTELVRGVVAASSLMAVSEGITLEFWQKEPVYVWGDEFKIEQVISNYLSNAIHHAKGEKKIVVSFERRDTLLRVCVFNTGENIPEEEIEKVWIKFYKVDKARTREYGGSGIGLSIVKAIMDSHHQKCGVINHENGVEFWMELECCN